MKTCVPYFFNAVFIINSQTIAITNRFFAENRMPVFGIMARAGVNFPLTGFTKSPLFVNGFAKVWTNARRHLGQSCGRIGWG